MGAIPVWLGAILLLLGAIALSGGVFAHLVYEPGLGGDHLRTCTASAVCSSACRAKRTSSAPATTCMYMRDDTTSTDRTPSTALDESAVRDDSCTQVPSVSCMGSTASKFWGLFSSMGAIFGSLLHRNNVQLNGDRT